MNYQTWISHPARLQSQEVDFGVWWNVPGSRYQWRVSWIQATGELYAVEQSPSENKRMMLLGVYTTRDEVERVMQGWGDISPHLVRIFPEIARTVWP